MNILEALEQSKAKQPAPVSDKLERVMIDGLWSISDECLEVALWELGIDHETISWRLKEQVSNREAVIAMYGEMK